MDITQSLVLDYQNFPKRQTFSLYAEDVYFKDPMTSFYGCERYQQMIAFIDQWFKNPTLALHQIQQSDRTIRTDWTLEWTTPLPWNPRIRISGWSELTLNAEGLISSHIDYWHCSRFDVLKQHFVQTSASTSDEEL